MNFTFAASKPPDGGFGSLKPNGNWTGMIGELVNQNADIGMVFWCKLIRLELKISCFQSETLVHVFCF